MWWISGQGVVLFTLRLQRCNTGFADIGPLLASLLLGMEAPSDHSPERGRKVWLQQGLEDGANLEAFALFLCVSAHMYAHPSC